VSAVRPRRLEAGAAVRIVAPAGPVDPAGLAAGAREIAARGYGIHVAENAAAHTGYLAGGDGERLTALQAAIDDPAARAIWAARGGYGTTRILDDLRLDRLAADPPWVVGSSDLTALLLELWARHRVVSVHGPMAARLPDTDPRDAAATFALLGGGGPEPIDTLSPLVAGTARGPLVGGNLCVIAHCLGALDPRFADGAILFLEEVSERPYRIDRSLVQLARAGVLDGVAGVVVGELTACDPNPDGVTAADVVRERLAGLGVRVATGYPAAHGARNRPFLHGGEAELEVTSARAALRPA
jgi:muramoyltetrapeptide carboxypeptidase